MEVRAAADLSDEELNSLMDPGEKHKFSRIFDF